MAQEHAQQATPAQAGNSKPRSKRNPIQRVADKAVELVSGSAEPAHQAVMLGDVDLAASTYKKDVEGTIRFFFINFLPGGKLREVFGDDPTHLIDGSYAIKDGVVTITTKSDVEYVWKSEGKPNMFGVLRGTEQPGGTTMVLTPIGRKVEF